MNVDDSVTDERLERRLENEMEISNIGIGTESVDIVEVDNVDFVDCEDE
jgi:hypothetical protein